MLNALHCSQQQIVLTSLKIRERDGGQQRINTLKLRVKTQIFSRHTVKLATYEVIFGLIT